jgi:hypothetical protein
MLIFLSHSPTSLPLVRYRVHRLCRRFSRSPTIRSIQDDAAIELFEDMANRARDGDWGMMRTEEEQWRLAGCYYLALRCLIYLLHAFPSLTLVRLPTSD